MQEILLIRILLAVVFTEALTEIIVEARIAEPLRLRVIRTGKFFRLLFTCGYCMSVWVAVGTAYLFNLHIGWLGARWIEPLILGIVVHRFSNGLHDLMGILRRIKFPVFPPLDE